MRCNQLRSLVVILILCLTVLLLGGAPSAIAQSTSTGTIVGTVTDQSGAVVNGASVTLTDAATKTVRTAATNDAGRYIFVDVAPGAYELTYSKQTFSTTKTQATVTVGVTSTLNISLQVGGGNVVVEVTAVGTELQTMNATVGNTVTAVSLDNLPMIGRDVNTFIELQPGVSANGDVAGAVNDQSYFSLDGGNNSNDMDGSGGVYTATQQNLVIGDTTGGMANPIGSGYSSPSGVLPTPADSVEEFKVNTAGQTADFNSSAGAEIKIVTKRGGDRFHGTAYEYYKDNNWSSNSWQNSYFNSLAAQNGQPEAAGLPSYHYSRFGGAIGGPLIPKEVLGGKTFFFFNYEGFRYPQSQTIFRNVPSPALQLGLLYDTGITNGVKDANYGNIVYNLNNVNVTYNGKTYLANMGCATLCDPQGLGVNPLVSQIWSKYAPASNAGCASGQNLCDNYNVLGFAGTLSTPITSKFAVGRIDHDFSSKQHFMASYRYYNIKVTGTEQVDIGGFFPGDKLGTPASASSDPVQDWYLVAGLTSNITNNTTNDFHFSHLRNWWAWSRNGAPPQIPGLGGALELDAGQSATQDLGPFNVNNQQIRRRFWDGDDNMFRDDVSMLKGNHLFQFGGTFQRNFNYHQRNDSGGTINAYPVYSLGNGSTGAGADHATVCIPTATITGITVSQKACDSLVATDLGVVSIASQMFARSGPNLTLQPPLSNAFDKSHIPYYNVYFSDTWHMKPTLTLTYGLGYALEMPPIEENGKQSVLVDLANQPVSVASYIATTRKLALQGQVFNPIMGFNLVGNAANGLKYPYNPFYGEFSPRAAFAWAPKASSGALSNTVLRFGYGRSYGRTNGVVQVLVPLLGLGLEQPFACRSNLITASAWNCGASGAPTFGAGPNAAFRVGQTASATGGPTVPLINTLTTTLPQPVYPGINNGPSSTPEGLDPNFRANAIDSFDLTYQKQLNRRISVEVGYIFRRITHEYEPVELSPVPYMMTLGGQSFKQAYANTVLQYCGGLAGLGGGGCGGSALPNPGPGPQAGNVTAQPFFETALASTGYCNGFANCTQAVVANEGANGTGNLTNAQVWGLWSDLDSSCPGCTPNPDGTTGTGGGIGGFNFPRSLQTTPIHSTCAALGGTGTSGCAGQYTDGAYQNASIGYGNYNAGFVSLKIADWHGLNAQSNFTWSKALGTGANAQSSSVLTALDPFNLQEMYGRQSWDRKFLFNTYFVYSPAFFKGQSGLMGRALGGWTFSAIFAAGSGIPTQVGTTFGDYQAFGACDGVGCGDYDSENAVPIGPVPHTKAYKCPSFNLGAGFCASQSNGFPVNYFPTAAAQASNWRNPILGVDNRDGGNGILNGLAYWNMDFSIHKNILVTEGVSVELQGIFANVFNHNQWTDNYLGLYNTGGFGALGFNNEAEPRNMELGLRIKF